MQFPGKFFQRETDSWAVPPLLLSLFILSAGTTDVMAEAQAAVLSHDVIIRLEVRH